MYQPRLLIACLALAAAGGCKSDEPEVDEGQKPPPIASAAPGICDEGGGLVGDNEAAAYFPRKSGGYCVDPNGETRAYGEGAGGSLDDVCTEQFDGECEVYKKYGLRRVVTVRYVDGKGSPGAVSVTLSRFETKEGAYGFYTKRVIADGDPLKVSPKELEVAGAGALGSGIAYVWKGQHVAELAYTNEVEPPDAVKKSSHEVLPPIARAIGDKLPGEDGLPKEAEALPEAERIKQGIRYEIDDVLGISGTGPGAIGYYKDGKRRYRQFALARPDEAAAKDVLRTLEKHPGAKELDDPQRKVILLPLQQDDGAVITDWVITRQGAWVFGVGDEELVLLADQSKEQRAEVQLERDAKLKKLEALVGARK